MNERDYREAEEAFLARMEAQLQKSDSWVYRYPDGIVADLGRLIEMARRQRRVLMMTEPETRTVTSFDAKTMTEMSETYTVRKIGAIASKRHMSRTLELRTTISEDLIDDISDKEMAALLGDLVMRSAKDELHKERQQKEATRGWAKVTEQ